MGTGSVTGWFFREFSVCRRCLSPFSDGPLFRMGNTEHRGKRGQAPRGYGFPRNSGRYRHRVFNTPVPVPIFH